LLHVALHTLVLLSFPTRRSSDLIDPFQLTQILRILEDALDPSGSTLEPIRIELSKKPKLKIEEMSDSGFVSVDLSEVVVEETLPDRKSTRLNSSHLVISYAVFCL